MRNPLDEDSFQSDYGLEDLHLIAHPMCAVGINWEAPDKLKRYVLAAMAAYIGRYKSVDYVLKTHSGIPIPKLSENSILIHEMTHQVKRTVLDILKRNEELQSGSDRPGLVAADAALLRLWNTFTTAIYTVRNAYHFETAQLEKLILEQLAWVYAIHSYEDDKYFSVKPSKCITGLEKLYPKIGKFYGKLNEIGHISPESTKRYIHSEDGDLLITLVSLEFRESDACYLLFLCDVLAVISEIIHFDNINQSTLILRNDYGNLVAQPARPTAVLLRKYMSQLYKHEETKNESGAKQVV